MRMAMSCLGLVLSSVATGGVCSAQTFKVAPAKKVDNAATLYALALAELSRIAPDGSISVPKNVPKGARAPALPQRVQILIDANVVNHDPGPERTSRLLKQTALARSLFAQAATRANCAFAVVPARQAAERDAAFAKLVELVIGNAFLNVESNPSVACDDAITVLRFYSHRSQGAGVGKLLEMFPLERQALDMLKRGLTNLRVDRYWAARSKRYVAALQEHKASRFQENAIAATVLKGVKEKVELHRARLRDMHMKVPGGFDQAKMCKQLEGVVAKCMDVPDAEGMHIADWLEQVEKRLAVVMPKPLEDASVTEKATYGMAQLVVPRGTRVAQENRWNLAVMGACFELIKMRDQQARQR